MKTMNSKQNHSNFPKITMQQWSNVNFFPTEITFNRFHLIVCKVAKALVANMADVPSQKTVQYKFWLLRNIIYAEKNSRINQKRFRS